MPGYSPESGPDPNVHDVSLIQLIVRPEKFDGERVRFIGFLTLLREGYAIYLHREDFVHGISRNAVWIDVPTDMTIQQQGEVNMRYVICVGVFRAGHRGHMEMFSGAITDVRRLELWFDLPLPTEAMPSSQR
jgi:hypothetical protein